MQPEEDEPDDVWALLDAEARPSLYEVRDEPVVLRKALEKVLLQLALVPVSPAARIEGAETARLKPGPSAPRRVGDETAVFLRDFAKCETNAQRLAVIKAAQDRLTALRYSPVSERVGLRRGTLDFKIAIGTDERPVAVVASIFGVSPKTVRRYKRRFRPQEGG